MAVKPQGSFVNKQQAAEILGRSASWVEEYLIRTKRLIAAKRDKGRGGERFFKLADVERLKVELATTTKDGATLESWRARVENTRARLFLAKTSWVKKSDLIAVWQPIVEKVAELWQDWPERIADYIASVPANGYTDWDGPVVLPCSQTHGSERVEWENGAWNSPAVPQYARPIFTELFEEAAPSWAEMAQPMSDFLTAPEPEFSPPPMTVAEAKAQRERLQAALTRLETARKRGGYISREEAHELIATAVMEARTCWYSLRGPLMPLAGKRAEALELAKRAQVDAEGRLRIK